MTRTAACMVRAARTGLVAHHVDLPGDTDPLALLAGAPAERRFYWEHPDGGVAIAALGAAATVTAAGRDRFARIDAALAELRRDVPDTIAVGGFAFAADGAGGPAWRGFPPAEWTIPHLTVLRRGGRVRLVAVAPGDDGPAALAELAARAHAALRARTTPSARPATYRAAGAAPALWRRAVDATLDDIAAGRLRKLVLARACSLRASKSFDPVHVVARLRHAFPECAVFAVAHGERRPRRGIAGAPGAGHRAPPGHRRGGGQRPARRLGGSDRRRARALALDPKERAEHALVVDDVRARLARVCDRVVVPATPLVLATQAVQHLHTPIHGRLRAGVGLWDVVAALHPTPAVCGVPRALAYDALATREGMPRGWYTGGVGWIGPAGGEITVALRTALLRGPQALLHAGAGIVAGSSWEAELEETRLKLRPLLAALLEL